MGDTVTIVNLGSGSKGNATVIWNRDGGVLIDSGFSRRELLARMDEAEVPRDCITAVLLSHEHADHGKGVRLACDFFRAPLYISANTFQWARNNSSRLDLPNEKEIHRFLPGSTIQHAGMKIEPFLVMHDAIEPVAFTLTAGTVKIGIATDMGKLNLLAMQRLHGCDYLMIESNYDKNLLMNSSRPVSLKRRIMGTHGHLDNAIASEALDELLSANTRHLTLAHLSSECNSHEIVEEMFARRLEELGRCDIFLSVARQAQPLIPTTLAL